MSDHLGQTNLQLAREYLRLIETSAAPADFEKIIHPDVSQEEFPNLLFPDGAKRDRQAMLSGIERGKELLVSQQYQVNNTVAAGEWVALEIRWQGILAVDLGPMKAGDTLTAHVGTFIQFKDGCIIAQRNYDCYEPVGSK